jgi:peptidoglycan/LPS O-acetylase OafA/YrhL
MANLPPLTAPPPPANDDRGRPDDLVAEGGEGPERVAIRASRVPDAGRTGPGAGHHRFGLIDALRGLAATVIAVHHICIYGPLPERAARLVPGLIGVIDEYGRFAVQVFFVISGFVTALAVGRRPITPSAFARFAAARYVRLGFPYLATIAAILTLHAFSPPGFAAFPLFDALSWKLVLAHVFFLQDILGYPSLSAGIWYLGIDYQFCVLFFSLMLLHRGLVRVFRIRSPRLDTAMLLALFVPGAVMSIFVWNLNYDDEPWVHCYACSLFVGVACAWALSGRVPRWVFWAYAGVVTAGLIYDWRRRLALALATGILIYFAGRDGRTLDRDIRPWLRSLGRISFSLFLVHYPTHWVVSSLAARLSGDSALIALLAMALSFAASLAVAVAMFVLVERPSTILAERLR